MVLLLVFMQLMRDLFAIAKFLFVFCCTKNFTHYQVDSCWLVARVFEQANVVKTIAIIGIP